MRLIQRTHHSCLIRLVPTPFFRIGFKKLEMCGSGCAWFNFPCLKENETHAKSQQKKTKKFMTLTHEKVRHGYGKRTTKPATATPLSVASTVTNVINLCPQDDDDDDQ